MSQSKDAELAAAAIRDFQDTFAAVRREIARVVVGHDDVIDVILTALFAGGHVLIEGVPGIGKTLIVRSLAEALALRFSRIQFTVDLMPADITGTRVISETPDGRRELRLRARPGLRARAARRRDQPRDAEDAVGAARGDGRAAGDGGGHDARPAVAVLRARHAEPDRDGGHLPAARGAARPLPLQGAARLPVAGGARAHPRADHRRRDGDGPSRARSGDGAGARRGAAARWCATCWSRRTSSATSPSLVRLTLPAAGADPEVRRCVTYGASPRGGQALLLGAKVHALLDGRPHVAIERRRSRRARRPAPPPGDELRGRDRGRRPRRRRRARARRRARLAA